MIQRAAVILAALATLAPTLAGGQTVDTAAERARLANQRILAEAEQRAREEQERQGEASAVSAAPAVTQPSPGPVTPVGGAAAPAPTALPGPNPATMPQAPAAPPPRAEEEDPTSRALEQLRELGELKDAGYLTDEEFQRIKARILERRF